MSSPPPEPAPVLELAIIIAFVVGVIGVLLLVMMLGH
jgi:hypothetical protein